MSDTSVVIMGNGIIRGGENLVMRIQTIEITNFKAFLGAHKINVGGKSLFIYGENGSGRSSLYLCTEGLFSVFHRRYRLG